MASQGLTGNERASAVALLEWTAGQLLRSAGHLTRTQWNFRPEAGSWSAGDIVEHLILTERNIVGRLHALVRKHPPTASRQPEVAGKEKLILRTVPDRGTKLKAPPGFEPAQTRAPLATLAEFLAVRNATIDYVRDTVDDVRGYYSNHITLQLLDGYQWLLLVAVHNERHLLQLAELKSQPRFPA